MSRSSNVARSPSCTACVTKPLVKVSMPVGASVADWLSTVVAFQMGKASADANRRKTKTLRYLTMCHLLGDSKCTCVRIRIEGLQNCRPLFSFALVSGLVLLES